MSAPRPGDLRKVLLRWFVNCALKAQPRSAVAVAVGRLDRSRVSIGRGVSTTPVCDFYADWPLMTGDLWQDWDSRDGVQYRTCVRGCQRGVVSGPGRCKVRPGVVRRGFWPGIFHARSMGAVGDAVAAATTPVNGSGDGLNEPAATWMLNGGCASASHYGHSRIMTRTATGSPVTRPIPPSPIASRRTTGRWAAAAMALPESVGAGWQPAPTLLTTRTRRISITPNCRRQPAAPITHSAQEPLLWQ